MVSEVFELLAMTFYRGECNISVQIVSIYPSSWIWSSAWVWIINYARLGVKQ